MPPASVPSDVIAVVLAGGQGTRLHELTARECKPALPFRQGHRIVDFTLASLARSGLKSALIATQYHPETLNRHLQSVWSPAFADGGLVVRHGLDVAGSEGYSGTADVLRVNSELIDSLGARHVLVTAADHIYAMDYRPFIAQHLVSGAAITIAAMPVDRAGASRFGIISEGAAQRVTAFAEKPADPAALPDDPTQSLASLGIYVVDWAWLRQRLADPLLMDFGQHVIPAAVAAGQAQVWRWQGYWRDVGTLDSLRESWLDFEGGAPCQRPFANGVVAFGTDGAPTRNRFHARINLGGLRLFSPLRGSEDMARWAMLDRSVVMPGAQVSPGVRLTNTIVAPGAIVPEGLHIGENPEADRRWFRVSGDTVLVTSAMLARRAASVTPVLPRASLPFSLPRRLLGLT